MPVGRERLAWGARAVLSLMAVLLATLGWLAPVAAGSALPQSPPAAASGTDPQSPPTTAGTESKPPAATATSGKRQKRDANRDNDEEVRLGRRAAADLEREYKLVKDPKQLARLERIGRELAAVSDEPRYHYTFKILDDADINALSLPGGFVYVTKGMMGYVRSDDELAGVLGHEIAHAARHHVKDLLKREARLNQNMVIGLLGAILLGGAKSDGLGNLLFGAEMVKTAYLTGYSQKTEAEADHYGTEYVIKTGKFNPVGVLTLIERLARDEARSAGPPLGIFQTHPGGKERAAALESFLRSRNIPINRIAVQDNLHATARDATTGGTPAAEVSFNGAVIFRTAGGVKAAQEIADHLNRLMAHDLQMRDVRLDAEHTTVLAQNEPLIQITAADAALEGKTPQEVADGAARNLARALWKHFMDQAF